MAKYLVIVPDYSHACRVCLAIDNTKLYSLHSDKQLCDLYEEFVSLSVYPRDGLPKYICSYCKALLLKAVAFKRKCCNTVKFLRDRILKETISIHTKNAFQLPYIRTEIVVDSLDSNTEEIKELKPNNINNFNCVDDSNIIHTYDSSEEKVRDNGSLHNENPILSSLLQNDNIGHDVDDIKDNSHHNDNIGDDDVDEEDVQQFHEDVDGVDEEELNNDGNSNVQKNRHCKSNVAKTTKTNLIDRSRLHRVVKMGSIPHLLKKAPTRQTLVNYIMKKYEKKSIELSNEHTAIVTDEDINNDGTSFRIKHEIDLKEELKLASDQSIPIQKKMLYTYIRDVYIRKKKKFQFVLPKNYVNFSIMDQERKERLEEFAKEYNFSVKTFTDEEQKQFLQRLAEKSKCCTIRCKLCMRGFVVESSLESHFKQIHDPSLGPASCHVCGKRFRDARRMQLHALVHKYQLQCNQCGQICRDTSVAKTHYDIHNGEQFPCPYCGKVFAKYKSRTNHMSLRHPQSRCDVCYRKMAGESALRLHRALKHRETFPCAACETVFNTEEARTAHVQDISADMVCSELFPCSACGENLSTESEKEDHINTYHSKAPKRIHSKKCCPCRCEHKTESSNKVSENAKECIENIVTDSYTEFIIESNDHDYLGADVTIITYEGGNGYNNESSQNNSTDNYQDNNSSNNNNNQDNNSSDNNNQDNNSSNNANNNKRKRTTIGCGCPCKKSKVCDTKNKVLCEVCAKFCSPEVMRYHRLIHTEEKPHTCALCSKSFRIKELLKIHMVSHTGERPHQCAECGKMYRTKGGLYKHKFVHTGERRHECVMCNKRFATSTGLQQHVKYVHLRVPAKPRVRKRK